VISATTPTKIREPEPLNQQLCTNKRCDEEQFLISYWPSGIRTGSRRTGFVSSTAGRNGGFRLFVGAPKDELIPVLSVAAAVGVGAEPEPREKGPGTTEGVAKVYGLSLPADMIP